MCGDGFAKAFTEGGAVRYGNALRDGILKDIAPQVCTEGAEEAYVFSTIGAGPGAIVNQVLEADRMDLLSNPNTVLIIAIEGQFLFNNENAWMSTGQYEKWSV